MINSIIFDLGGTVFTKGKTLFINYLSEFLGKDKAYIEEVIDGPLARDYRRGLISSDDYWRGVIRKLNTNQSAQSLKQKWFGYYKLNDRMDELLKDLQGHYNLFYISNNFPERVEYLRREHDVFKYFNGGVFSYEIGKLKSDSPGLLVALLKKYHLLPQETLYVDDKSSNLVRAKKMGMSTLIYVDGKNLLSEIKR